ncbi:MAG: hypothetical protein MSH08_01800 [Ezakiella sp.]|nr:hypothetical protein [Ezakiella sp.]
MNNIEKIIDILLDDKDLNLSVDQCEQIAELLDENGIGDLQKSKKEINSYETRIRKLNRIIDHLKDNLHNEKQAHLDTKQKLNAQAELADGARPNAAVEDIIDNIDYWIGGLWVEGYSPSSREVAKALIEYDLVKTSRPDDAAALEPTKWQLIAEDLEDKLEVAEEKLKQAQDIVKLNVLKPTDDQEEKEVDTYEITTVLFDDFAAKNFDVVDLLADAIDNKYPQMDQKYMIFGKYINRDKNAKGEDNEV